MPIYIDSPTIAAGMSLGAALASVVLTRSKARADRPAVAATWVSVVLFIIACACLPAFDWIERVLNVFVGVCTAIGGVLPLVGATLTLRWYRETRAEGRAYEPMELAASVPVAVVVLLGAAIVVVMPLAWVADYIPHWMEDLVRLLTFALIAWVFAFLLKLGGTVGVMARRIAAGAFLAVFVAADAALFWVLRERVTQPFLTVSALAVATAYIGAAQNASVRGRVSAAIANPGG